MPFDSAKLDAYRTAAKAKRRTAGEPANQPPAARPRLANVSSSPPPPAAKTELPFLAAVILRVAQSEPSIKILLPSFSISASEATSALARLNRNERASAVPGPSQHNVADDEDTGEEGGEDEEDEEDEEEDDSDAEEGVGEEDQHQTSSERMDSVLLRIIEDAQKLPGGAIELAESVMEVVNRGYDKSVNASVPRHWRLNVDGNLIPANRPRNVTSDRLLEIAPGYRHNYLLLAFAAILKTEPWLVPHYQKAKADRTTLKASTLVRLDHNARVGTSAGLYLLLSPSGLGYCGMANQFWLRMGSHGLPSYGAKSLKAEYKRHPFSTWSATILLDAGDAPTPIIHVYESILIASMTLNRPSAKGGNTNVFDKWFPQRPVILGRHVIAFFSDVHKHIASGELLPRQPKHVGDSSWIDLFGEASGHQFTSHTLWALVTGRSRKAITIPLLKLSPIPNSAWLGTIPSPPEAPKSGRVKGEICSTRTKVTTQDREIEKSALGLRNRR